MKILVTGNAGFIGFHTARALLERGDAVVGIDSVNSYYEPRLKEARLHELSKTAIATGSHYEFVRANLANPTALEQVFKGRAFDRVIHMAAQPGVRYSLENPRAYTESNIEGFINVLEACRHAKVAHLTYASSSSVYGANTKRPSSEHDGVDHPVSLYAATKRANELMAHAYSHLYRLPTTGLRFFTVYGPWGRPDMAPMIFARKILDGEPIQVFNSGNHTRDFTYVDDIVAGVIRASDQIAVPNAAWNSESPDPANSSAPYRLFNIGNNSPIKLLDYIAALELCLGRAAVRQMLPLQAGDIPDTCADVSELHRAVQYCPSTPVVEGVKHFVAWYTEWCKKQTT